MNRLVILAIYSVFSVLCQISYAEVERGNGGYGIFCKLKLDEDKKNNFYSNSSNFLTSRTEELLSYYSVDSHSEEKTLFFYDTLTALKKDNSGDDNSKLLKPSQDPRTLSYILARTLNPTIANYYIALYLAIFDGYMETNGFLKITFKKDNLQSFKREIIQPTEENNIASRFLLGTDDQLINIDEIHHGCKNPGVANIELRQLIIRTELEESSEIQYLVNSPDLKNLPIYQHSWIVFHELLWNFSNSDNIAANTIRNLNFYFHSNKFLNVFNQSVGSDQILEFGTLIPNEQILDLDLESLVSQLNDRYIPNWLFERLGRENYVSTNTVQHYPSWDIENPNDNFEELYEVQENEFIKIKSVFRKEPKE